MEGVANPIICKCGGNCYWTNGELICCKCAERNYEEETRLKREF